MYICVLSFKLFVMKRLWGIILVFIGIIIMLTIIYAYYGGFSKLDFKISHEGGENIVYKEMIGSYGNSGKMIDSVYNGLLGDYNIETIKGMGIYYDNPQYVEKKKLRSDIGCIIEKEDIGKLSKLDKTYKIKICPIGDYLNVQVPNEGSLSIMIGICRVYPKIEEYLKYNGYSNQGPIMEIYDTPYKTITYRKLLIKK